jgi:shikimate kinase
MEIIIMGVVSMFYGIIVSMYFFDNRRHKEPHIHVKYQENEIVIKIPGGEVLEGKIDSSKMKLVQAWIEIHKDELMADWELASSGESIFKIDPLK